MLMHDDEETEAEVEAEVEPAHTPEEDGAEETPMIPKVRLDEVLGTVRELKSTQDGLQQQLQTERDARIRAEEQAKGTKRDYTRPELQNMVDTGQITQETADGQLDKQTEARLSEKMEVRLAQFGQDTTLTNRVKAETDSYRKEIPDLAVDGSEARKKATAAYQRLVERGQPATPATELLAVEMAFGPIETLAKAKSGKHETHQETTASGQPDSAPKSDAPMKGLSKRAKDYYEDQIRKGRHKDWKEVNEMLARAPDRTRASLQS